MHGDDLHERGENILLHFKESVRWYYKEDIKYFKRLSGDKDIVTIEVLSEFCNVRVNVYEYDELSLQWTPPKEQCNHK